MVQGYAQTDRRGNSGWQTFGGFFGHGSKRSPGVCIGYPFTCPDIGGDTHEQWASYQPEESKLWRVGAVGREIGGTMLSVTGLNHFYYVCDFTDMRCKHSRVLSIIRERLHREPTDGDVFIVMSKNRRIVRMFTYDHRSYSLFEKKFVAGYQFMRVERDGDEKVYRIDWKDVVLLLESPIVKTLKIR